MLPVIPLIPPTTTISKISYVKATVKVFASIERINIASIPPLTAKKDPMIKDNDLCLKG